MLGAVDADAQRDDAQMLGEADAVDHHRHQVQCGQIRRRAKAATAKQAFAELLASTCQILGRDTSVNQVDGPAALTELLESAETTAIDALDEYRSEAATVAGRLAAVHAAATELQSTEAEYPVCRRQLSPDDVTHAEGLHQRDISALSAREYELTRLIEGASKRLNGLRELSRQASRLPDIQPRPHHSTLDLDTATNAEDEARRRVEQLRDNAADARARRKVRRLRAIIAIK